MFALTDILPSIEVLVLVIVLAVNISLALAVYRSNPQSATHVLFSLLSVVIVLWLSTTYFFRLPNISEATALIWARLGIFFAAPMSTLFFLLAHTLPHKRIKLSRTWVWITTFITIGMMGINMSPYAFTAVETAENGARSLIAGVWLIPFSFFSTLFSVLAVYVLFHRYRLLHEGEQRAQVRLMLMGIFTMLSLIIVTVLVPIILFESAVFLSLSPLYTLVFLSMTAYGIVKHQLFDIKVIATQVLTVTLWIILFAKIFTNVSVSGRIIDTLIFGLVFVIGILLIRSVIREVRTREEIEKLAKDLERANKRLTELDQLKSEFLSIASHQMRSPLTAIKGYASLILEGTYGAVSDAVSEAVDKIFQSTESMIAVVESFLNVSRIEQGRMQYTFAKGDLRELVQDVANELKPIVDKKGLTLSFTAAPGDYTVRMDRDKLKQVFVNIIDNAVKYTHKGGITVRVDRQGNMIQTTIADTGVGMTRADIGKLFHRFSRAEGASKINTKGTGLGLYVAKEMVVAHKGEVWVESDGKGKGSTFFIELPAAKT